MRWSLGALVVLCLCQAVPAFGVECPGVAGAPQGSLGAEAGEARLKYLAKLVDDERAAAERWTLGWGATYGVLTIAQMGVMATVSAEDKPDWYWGAISTLVGVGFTILDPLEVMVSGADYTRRARAASDEQVCALVAEGEKLLDAGAEHERTGAAWYIHAANVVFNAGIGLILGLAYGHWLSGLINFLTGAAIGEATIFTSPMGLARAVDAYRAPGSAPPVVSELQLRPFGMMGLAIGGRF